jgi:hypothetical protein
MLLSSYLDEEKRILAARKTSPARFFLFGKGKIFLGSRKILPGRQLRTRQPPDQSDKKT